MALNILFAYLSVQMLLYTHNKCLSILFLKKIKKVFRSKRRYKEYIKNFYHIVYKMIKMEDEEMFVFSAKVNKKNTIIGLGLVGILIVGVAFLYPKENADEAMAKNSSVEITGTMGMNDVKIKNDIDVYNYLKSFGWSVSEMPLRAETVVIPKEFDDVYEKYNQLQERQGFNFDKAKGKKAMLYSFTINDHPSGEKGVIANVIVYKNKVIGGDISSSDVNGFIHGLTENS